MSQHEEQLRKLLNVIFDTHVAEHDMDCEMCNQRLERFAELVAAGGKLCDLLPELDNHLCCCPDCREEFEALVAILRAENEGYFTKPTENP